MTQALTLADPVPINARLEDDDALARSAGSQPEAFDELYSRYMPRVYRYLHARLGSQEDAADLTQTVFLRAWSAIPAYRSGRAPFAAWLFRIARNAATDQHRAKRPSVSLDALGDSSVIAGDGASTPESIYLAEERLDALRNRVSALSAGKQEMLALRFAAGLSSREIGALTGRSEAAVKKQLTRTIDALKEHYRDESR